MKQRRSLREVLASGGVSAAIASVLAVLVGILFGAGILFAVNAQNALEGVRIILLGGFNEGAYGLGQALYYATPLIMTGLSVGFAFKTGLFNIGAAGQYMVGSFAAVYVGYTWTFLPAPWHWIVALLAGVLAGGLWGAIPGLFKALLNVHEVIASIMCNYIAMYGINYLIVHSAVYNQRTNQTFNVAVSAVLPKGGLDQLFFKTQGSVVRPASVNAGLYIAIACAILIYLLLNKTTFGYELKACGFNRHAARYAGINGKRSIALSMIIAGALAGLGGALMHLSPATNTAVNTILVDGQEVTQRILTTGGLVIPVEEVLAAEGFNGISVALLGFSNPLAILLSAFFIAHITQGGFYLQRLSYMPEIIEIIIALIIYFSAFSLFVRGLLGRAAARRKMAAPGDGEKEDD